MAHRKIFALIVASGVALGRWAPASAAPDLIVSANDGKFVRESGRGTYPNPKAKDSVVLVDVTAEPKALSEVEVRHSVHGPPQSVALSRDGATAFVSAPDTYDHDAQQRRALTVVQVVDFEKKKVVQRLELGAHPQALALTPDGQRLLVVTTEGDVKVVARRDGAWAVVQAVDLGSGLLGSLAVLPDGTKALVADREAGGLSVLDLTGDSVRLLPERVSSGVTPYAVDVSEDGRWAVVSNVGLAAIDGRRGTLVADVDTVTLVDLSSYPFRAVQHLTVPSVPEGVAISPDGRWVAAVCMNGSHLPPGAAGHRPQGAVKLFRIREGRATAVGTTEIGPAPQGAVFTRDSRRLIVQLNVDRALGVWRVTPRGLLDTGQRLALSGGPTSIRARPF
jgi:DNA-binding beta-propeller fold protein YncE